MQEQNTTQAPQPSGKKAAPTGDNRKTLLWIIIVLAVAVVGLGAWFLISSTSQERQLKEAIAQKEQAELDASQRELQNVYDSLNSQFADIENGRNLVLDDSVKLELQMKYENARLQVERLQQELRNQQNLSAAEIKRLKDEIATLRDLLRHYVEEINRLQLENDSLRTENAQIREHNRQLSNQVEQTSRQNEELNERMTLAERLNVTGLSLTALNKKGKEEKKIKNVKQLRVIFTIPQNNSTPVGSKTIYLRITSPSGQLLGNAGTFSFEGANVAYSAKTVIEYSGEEIAGITIFWDVNTTLTAGEYTVELFADNFRLTSRSFELNLK